MQTTDTMATASPVDTTTQPGTAGSRACDGWDSCPNPDHDHASKTPNPFRFNPPTAVECPPWCALPAGHAYDSEDEADGSRMRWHVARIAGSEVVTVEALGTWREGREELATPHICMWLDASKADDVIPDAATARRHAAALVEAAEVLEELLRH